MDDAVALSYYGIFRGIDNLRPSSDSGTQELWRQHLRFMFVEQTNLVCQFVCAAIGVRFNPKLSLRNTPRNLR